MNDSKTSKIVFVVHTAYPQFIGGRERHVHNLARAMARKGYDVSVLAGGKGRRRECSQSEGYTLILLPMWSLKVSSSPLQVYRIIPGLGRELAAIDPDIVHAFEYGSCTTDAAFIYAKKYKKRFFLTVYGYKLGNVLLRFAKHVYNRCMGGKIIQFAEKVICPSLAQQEEVLTWVSPDQWEIVSKKILVRGNGIACHEFSSSVMQQECSSKDGDVINILTVTRILPRKGMKYLISAMRILRYELGLEHVKLYIVGPDCGERRILEALVRSYKLDAYISFEGEVPYHQVHEYLRRCDIFVLPSLYEGLPLALLEAMAAARPVVFTRLPCAQQIIRDKENGILVKPACSKSLAQGLELLIRDKDLRSRIGANAAACVHQFDSLQEADVVGSLYDHGNLRSGSMKKRLDDAKLWNELACANKNRSHIDPVFGRYKSEQFCAFAAKWHQFAGGETVLKTDLREEAYGADEVLFSLSDPGLSFFGIDISSEVVGAALAQSMQRRLTHRYVTADVRRIPFRDNSFDVVLSSSTLDHFLSYDDLLAALAEIRRVLKPTGKLIMTLNNKHNLNFWFMVTMEKALGISRYPVVFFSRAQIRRACEDAGLRVLGFESVVHIVSPFNTCALIARRFVPQRQADSVARAVLKLAALFERNGVTKWLTGWFIGAVCVPEQKRVVGE